VGRSAIRGWHSFAGGKYRQFLVGVVRQIKDFDGVEAPSPQVNIIQLVSDYPQLKSFDLLKMTGIPRHKRKPHG